MKGRRGHYCHVCKRLRPNEAFSGKGHARHVCKKCSQMPREEREAIEHTDEIFGFMNQSHISEKNVARLKVLVASPNREIAELAGIVLEVAELKPYKRRRMKVLAHERPDLLERVTDAGLDFAHHW